MGSLRAPIGEKVQGRYQILERLGRGGMATIYRVHDLSTGRELALKQLELPENAAAQDDVATAFEREFHVLAQLSHPRVVQVYDYGKDVRGSFYTMELLDGGDVRERAPLPWQEACAVAHDVCSALALLHSHRRRRPGFDRGALGAGDPHRQGAALHRRHRRERAQPR
jgi:serine/threonine-protein kinase